MQRTAQNFQSNKPFTSFSQRVTTAGAAMRLFLFATATRPTLGPTHPAIQRVSWALTPGVK